MTEAANTIRTADSNAAVRPGKSPKNRKTNRRISRNVFIFFAFIAVMLFFLIGLSAYSASIQHANNMLANENSSLEAEIDSLNSRIVEATKVTKIEQTATVDYGMVYPTEENCIYIREDADKEGNLAATIKGEAYN